MKSDSLTTRQLTIVYIFILFIFGMMITSCVKPDTYMRNYAYPAYKESPTENLASACILVELGEDDESIMKRIRAFTYKNFADTNEYPYIFLSTNVYSQMLGNRDVDNPNPKYMLFPHSIDSQSDKWGWEYYYELQELIQCQGKKQGEQTFCDKYLNGVRTIGMKLE